MFSDTRPAPLDGLDDFRIAGTAEVRALIKSLQDRNVALSISASNGAQCSATIWSMDTAHHKLALSVDNHSPAVQQVIEADEAVAVGYLDQVKLQFDVADRLLVRSGHHAVMQASVPHEMFRFQRRASFRVRTLERSQPTASFRHPQMPEMRLDLRVLDVSLGGCALFLPLSMPGVQPGIRIQGVSLTLDTDTQFVTSLVLHHVTSIQPQITGVRLGCEFGSLAPADSRLLQRYIDNTQKRRRMLALD
jgi:c-di-GMP-binding flagellar brake protein YcgR